METSKSCIDCFNCRTRHDRVWCRYGMWQEKNGCEFAYKSIERAKEASRTVLRGKSNGYMSFAETCPYYDD